MLVFYLFVPAAASVFLLMAIASIPREVFASAKAAVATHLILFRFAILALIATGYYASEVFRLVIECWFVFSLPGIAMYVFNRKGLSDILFLRFVFPFRVALYIWRGFCW